MLPQGDMNLIISRTTKSVRKSTAPPTELDTPSKFMIINQCSSRVDKHFFTSQMTTNTKSQLMNISRRNTAYKLQ